MTQSKHTPIENWIAVGSWVENIDDNNADICSCNPSDFGQGHMKMPIEEQCANAELIVHCVTMHDELLNALEEMLSYYPEPNGTTLKAEKVISKARGE